MDRADAEALLKISLGAPNVTFRHGQWEAIDVLVNQRRKLLVVQRTGWGKSSVYFISTKIFRDQGMGPTIIVSPLLALMRNQIDSAKRLGINAVTMNSTNRDDWQEVTRQMLADEIDCLLISPERLANDDFVETVLNPVANRISMMVIDEAHCISDWGHDFRPDYRRIVNILRQIPDNTPVLGTTATANNRVVTDIQEQLGNILIQRGSLARESLSLQCKVVPDQSARLAWLAKIIPSLDGTGVVYTLTTRDADQVALWLRRNGIEAHAYYGNVKNEGFPDSNSYRIHLEQLLLNNEIKVLVATSALGMGYDKPDLRFVIHYQTPGSVVSYYQEVGRAGRGVDDAVGILLSGTEDQKIHDYFRRSAFPPAAQVEEILNVLDESDGMTLRELEEQTNLRSGIITQVLKLLSAENQAPVIKQGSRWHRTPINYQMDQERIDHLTSQREDEWQEMRSYVDTQDCKMAFLKDALDDADLTPCGRCQSCIGSPIIDVDVSPPECHTASQFLKNSETRIEPKRQVAANAFPQYGFRGTLPTTLQAQVGRVLSRWGDAGWGGVVAHGKHNGSFNDDLVEAMADMIQSRWQPTSAPTWVCCIPSRNNPDLVPNFARRLAARLGLPFVDAIEKVLDNEPQKYQQNRYHQCRNLDGAFAISTPLPDGPALLIDDVFDSGWTFAVVAALLQQSGSGVVYPAALASSSVGS